MSVSSILQWAGDGLVKVNTPGGPGSPGDFQRVLRNAPLGAAVGALIGGGAGALIAIRTRPEEETKKDAAIRGAKRGGVMGAVFGFVSGMAIRPPLEAKSDELELLDKAVKKVLKKGLPPEHANYKKSQWLDAVVGIVERHNNVMEPVALASGATGMKMYANLNLKKAKATDDPEEKKKLQLLAAANHVIAWYLASRIIGKCWSRIRVTYPELAMGKAADGGAWLVNTATSSPVQWKNLFEAAFGPTVS